MYFCRKIVWFVSTADIASKSLKENIFRIIIFTKYFWKYALAKQRKTMSEW